MLVTIKPHSSYRFLFDEPSYSVDINVYSDVLYYLSSIHPKFAIYCKQQALVVQQEDFAIVDKNLKVVKNEEQAIRAAKEGDTLYIVPAITGGGGKRNVLIMGLLAAAFIFLPTFAPGLAEITLFGSEMNMAMLSKQIGISLAMGAAASLFAPEPETQEQSRESGLFSGLQNTTESGVPVALHYGMVRIAGQMLSGYINTVTHGKSETVTVEGELYDYTSNPNNITTESLFGDSP